MKRALIIITIITKHYIIKDAGTVRFTEGTVMCGSKEKGVDNITIRVDTSAVDNNTDEECKFSLLFIHSYCVYYTQEGQQTLH